MTRLSHHLLCAYFIILPILWALSLSASIDAHLARILVIPLTLLTLLVCLWRRQCIVPVGPVAFFFVLWLLIMSLSLLYTPVPAWTLRKLAYFWLFAPLCWIIYQHIIWHERAAIRITASVVYGAALASVIALTQFFLQFIIGRETVADLWVQITPFFLGGTLSETVITYNSWYVHILGHDLFRAIGFFPDPHVAAFYTGLILPLSFGLYRHLRQSRYLWTTMLILCANLMTFSRGAEVALIVGIIIALILLWRTLHIHRKHALLFLAAGALLLVMIPGNSLTARLLSSFDAGDTSNTARITIWTETLSIWSEAPLLGTGLGAYAYVIDPRSDYRTPIYAHNLFLDIGVELGALGLIAFLCLVIAIYRSFARSTHPLAPYAIISMSIYLTHSLFDTALYSVHALPPLLFLIAFAAAQERR